MCRRNERGPLTKGIGPEDFVSGKLNFGTDGRSRRSGRSESLQNSKFIYQKPVQFRVFFWLLILSFSLFLDLGREGECRVIVC